MCFLRFESLGKYFIIANQHFTHNLYLKPNAKLKFKFKYEDMDSTISIALTSINPYVALSRYMIKNLWWSPNTYGLYKLSHNNQTLVSKGYGYPNSQKKGYGYPLLHSVQAMFRQEIISKQWKIIQRRSVRVPQLRLPPRIIKFSILFEKT